MILRWQNLFHPDDNLFLLQNLPLVLKCNQVINGQQRHVSIYTSAYHASSRCPDHFCVFCVMSSLQNVKGAHLHWNNKSATYRHYFLALPHSVHLPLSFFISSVGMLSQKSTTSCSDDVFFCYVFGRASTKCWQVILTFLFNTVLG